MEFKIQETEKLINGIAKYVKGDYSFDFEPIQASSYSILIGDLTLSFDWNLNARQVWGYNPLGKWITKSLFPPIATKGLLILTDYDEIDNRMLDSENWNTYYDSISGWVCIGAYSFESKDLAVEFATNTIVILKSS
jgi:hypothetical protein